MKDWNWPGTSDNYVAETFKPHERSECIIKLASTSAIGRARLCAANISL